MLQEDLADTAAAQVSPSAVRAMDAANAVQNNVLPASAAQPEGMLAGIAFPDVADPNDNLQGAAQHHDMLMNNDQLDIVLAGAIQHAQVLVDNGQADTSSG